MNTPDFSAATAFVAANARVLDRRRFQRLFQDRPAAPVRDAVAAYRNEDGGFGHALEPDCRAPGSQPLAGDMALRVMDETGAGGRPRGGAPGAGGGGAPPRRGRCRRGRADLAGLAARAVVGPRGRPPRL